jgi:hypothetical protein
MEKSDGLGLRLLGKLRCAAFVFGMYIQELIIQEANRS